MIARLRSLRGPALGMACVLASVAFASAQNAMIRGLSSGLPPVEIAFFRAFFGLILQLPVLYWLGTHTLKTTRFRLHAVRGTVQAVSMMLFFTGLSLVPLAQTTALEFAAPLIATLFAILFLGDSIRIRRIVALAVGFIGVLVVVRPGFAEVSHGQIIILISVAMWAGCQLMIRSLSRTEGAFQQGFYMAAFLAPITLIGSIPTWVWPSAPMLGWLAVLAGIATMGSWLYGEAFRHAEMSAIFPLESTKILWTTAYGWLFFFEQPDWLTLVGGFVIFAAATYITLREAQLARRTAPPPKLGPEE